MNAIIEKVRIITDGACLKNPGGPGGWGALLRFGPHLKEISGGEPESTNNRMELMAVIQGLNALKRPCEVHVTTDSKYVMNGITTWVHNWINNGWRTQSKQPVKNVELWQQLMEAVGRHHDVSWKWVKGHNGHPDNERADFLATQAARTFCNN